MGLFDWLDSHSGPESSGSQEGSSDKGGGSSRVDADTGKVHNTDWDSKGNRASWDEDLRSGKVSGHHKTKS